MNGRRRWLIQIVMVLRSEFRNSFEWSFCQKWGHFSDHHLSRQIHSYADWIDYPSGDHTQPLECVLPSTLKIPLVCSVVSDDGSRAFTGSMDGQIRCYDLSKCKQIAKWTAHENGVITGMCYHRRGMILSRGTDHQIRLWNEFNFELITSIVIDNGEDLTKFAINHKGDQIATYVDKSVHLWSVDNGECIRVFPEDTQFLYSLRYLFSDVLISGTMDGTTKILDTFNGRMIRILEENVGCTMDVRINCDSSLLVCLHPTGIKVYTWPDCHLTSTIQPSGRLACFHPKNPDILAYALSNDHRISVYDITKDECIRVLNKHSEVINGMSFTRDGTRLVSSSFHMLRMWDLSDLSE